MGETFWGPISKKCPFWPISSTALNFYIIPCSQKTRRLTYKLGSFSKWTWIYFRRKFFQVLHFGTKFGSLKCSYKYAKLPCSFGKYSYIKLLVNHTAISFHNHYSIFKFIHFHFAKKEEIWTSWKEHVSYYSLQMQLLLQLPNRTKLLPLSKSKNKNNREHA